VQINGSDTVRVHTHENWIDEFGHSNNDIREWRLSK
jgi:hypothetical protein